MFGHAEDLGPHRVHGARVFLFFEKVWRGGCPLKGLA